MPLAAEHCCGAEGVCVLLVAREQESEVQVVLMGASAEFQPHPLAKELRHGPLGPSVYPPEESTHTCPSLQLQQPRLVLSSFSAGPIRAEVALRGRPFLRLRPWPKAVRSPPADVPESGTAAKVMRQHCVVASAMGQQWCRHRLSLRWE